ncbi:MAG: MarR family winged helix-turn-helix transcriptional regulator [Oscillospiraceae bacterium]|nr:MarR family winged helix-turn-helix transcriptional regulator [Oscillospiraceae bacterium]
MNIFSEEMRRFNYLVGEINSLYHEAALRLGLSDSAFAVLYTVCNEGNCGISDVCRLTGVSKQTVNSALRKLENESVITLEALDGKQKRIALTAKGSRMVKNTAVKVAEAENRVFGAWNEKDRSEYLRLTERYLIDFRKEIDKL